MRWCGERKRVKEMVAVVCISESSETIGSRPAHLRVSVVGLPDYSSPVFLPTGVGPLHLSLRFLLRLEELHLFAEPHPPLDENPNGRQIKLRERRGSGYMQKDARASKKQRAGRYLWLEAPMGMQGSSHGNGISLEKKRPRRSGVDSIA